MPNVINYAEVWKRDIIDIFNQNALTSPFMTDRVNWLDAKTFNFTQMATSGYKNHSRDGGWNRGAVTQAKVPFTLTHDRNIEFLVDVADVDESNQTASLQNVSNVFIRTKAVPESDAYFFSKVATAAIGAGLSSSTALTAYTSANVYSKLKAMVTKGKLRLYKQNGSLIMYINSTIMDLLEQATDFTRKIDVTTIADGGTGIETRITSIDGMPVIEVIDTDRFYTAFNFTDGYKAAVGAYKINALIASTETVKEVNKINNIYTFAPGAHTVGDGYLYQNRALSDTFVFPNGLNNTVDSVFVDRDTVAVTA